MNNHLAPELLPVHDGVIEIKSLPEKDRFALINMHNEFAIAQLEKNGNLKTDVVLKNYPNSVSDGLPCKGLYSDDEGTIFWTIQTRAILALNTSTKETFDPLFAFGGNTVLVKTLIPDNKESVIMGEVIDLQGGMGKSKTYLISYEYKNGTLGEPGKPFKGYLFYIGNKEFLWCETLGSLHDVEWHICDIYFKNIRHNKLTDELTEKQIATWGNATPIHSNKRMMITRKRIKSTTQYFSIRWNLEMTDVKIEPLFVQIPQNGSVEDLWYFSDDGNWLTATFTTFFQEKKQTIVFFHIDDKYPQGISPPVFGEETYYLKDGCFLNHSDLGPLYLDWSPDQQHTLLVYKLNDVLKVLASKAGIE